MPTRIDTNGGAAKGDIRMNKYEEEGANASGPKKGVVKGGSQKKNKKYP